MIARKAMFRSLYRSRIEELKLDLSARLIDGSMGSRVMPRPVKTAVRHPCLRV